MRVTEARTGQLARPDRRDRRLVRQRAGRSPSRCGQPCFKAGRGDFARAAPSGKFFQDASSDEVDDRPSAKPAKADHLGKWDGRNGLGLAPSRLVTAEPARLNRGSGNEPGAAGVSLGVELVNILPS